MTVKTSLAEHPAVRAWSQFSGMQFSEMCAASCQIEELKKRADSNVFRLVGIGPASSSVIAKRCAKSAALAEQIIYREVLPRLPFSSLNYYGVWEEPERGCCWVFTEDAAGAPYSSEKRAHGMLAAEWLGRMHTDAERATRELGLFCWGADRYLDSLRAGRQRIWQNLANTALSEQDRVVLDGIVTQCNLIERNWSHIENLCAAAPQTFVHGDLHAKNLRVRTGRNGLTLVAFDWESAGRTVVAVDLALAGLDIATYCSAVLARWPGLAVEKLVRLGNIFQLLSLVDWESKRLCEEWLHKPMKHMQYYLDEMIRVIRAAELD